MTKKILIYLAKIFADRTGAPSAKRYACAVFGLAAVIFAACGFTADIIAVFVAGALGESIACVFEKGDTNGK